MQQKGDRMNRNALKQKCMHKGINYSDLPSKVGISYATFYRKTVNDTFTVKEIRAIKSFLCLTDKAVKEIFFDNNVAKMQHKRKLLTK